MSVSARLRNQKNEWFENSAPRSEVREPLAQLTKLQCNNQNCWSGPLKQFDGNINDCHHMWNSSVQRSWSALGRLLRLQSRHMVVRHYFVWAANWLASLQRHHSPWAQEHAVEGADIILQPGLEWRVSEANPSVFEVQSKRTHWNNGSAGTSLNLERLRAAGN